MQSFVFQIIYDKNEGLGYIQKKILGSKVKGERKVRRFNMQRLYYKEFGRFGNKIVFYFFCNGKLLRGWRKWYDLFKMLLKFNYLEDGGQRWRMGMKKERRQNDQIGNWLGIKKIEFIVGDVEVVSLLYLVI